MSVFSSPNPHYRICYLADTGPGRACMRAKYFSHVQLFVTLWTEAHQAPLSKRFSRQECCSGLPCLPLGSLPTQRSHPCLLHWCADSLPAESPGKPSLYSKCPVKLQLIRVLLLLQGTGGTWWESEATRLPYSRRTWGGKQQSRPPVLSLMPTPFL